MEGVNFFFTLLSEYHTEFNDFTDVYVCTFIGYGYHRML